jgi:hypothetical protein
VCACGPASLHVSEHARARPCLYACVCSRACHVRVRACAQVRPPCLDPHARGGGQRLRWCGHRQLRWGQGRFPPGPPTRCHIRTGTVPCQPALRSDCSGSSVPRVLESTSRGLRLAHGVMVQTLDGGSDRLPIGTFSINGTVCALPSLSLPYPTLPFPTLPYPFLPFPTLPIHLRPIPSHLLRLHFPSLSHSLSSPALPA